MKSDLVDIEVIFQTHTLNGLCVRETEKSPDVWLPRSEVEIEAKGGGNLRRGDVGILTGPERLLIEKGLL